MSETLTRLTAALANSYRIEREIGAGGMATVYLAEDVKHHRRVAVKVLRPEIAATLGADRFLREIEIAARLTHPHILPLHDSGEAQGFLYYVMPYVEGESLRGKLARQGELPVGEAVGILEEVVDALAHAHEQGLVHRDIKPDNVLLAGHHAMVTDFGVAKAVSEATGRQQLTTAGVALGTPAYMAPEQAAADPNTDHRADIYAVGIMGYEMLAGRPPFSGTTAQAILAAHVTEIPKPLADVRATTPPQLADAIMRCLEKKPADRWQSAADLRQQLAGMVTPTGGVTPTDTRPIKVTSSPPNGRRRWMVAGGVVAVAAAIGLFAIGGLGSGSSHATVDPNVMAVMPFRVAGADPQLTYLREGMIDLMAAKLTGEGGPRAADPRTVTSAWRGAASGSDGDLSEDQARAVALSVGAGQLMLGSIVGAPTRMVVSVTVLSAIDPSERSPATVEGPADSLPVLLDQLVAQVLARGAGIGSQRVASLTTTSLEALKAYLEGQKAYRAGRYPDASVALSRAISIDSSFALAAYSLVLTSGWTSVPQAGRVRELAWELRDRLSQRDQTLLEAYVGPNGPRLNSQLERLRARERAVQTVPDQADAWYFLGDSYYHWGKALGIPDAHERAARAFRRSLELDSTYVPNMGHLAHLMDRAGDTAEVRRLARRVLYEDSTTSEAEWWRWRLAQISGDPKQIAAARARLDSIDTGVGSIITFMQSDGVGLEGDDLDAAVRALKRGATSQGERSGAAFMSAMTSVNRGRPSAALPDWKQADAEWPVVLTALYGGGDSVAARQVIEAKAGAIDAPLSTGAGERSEQFGEACMVGQWHAWHGDAAATRAAAKLRRVSAELDDDGDQEWTRWCADLVEAVYATQTGSSRAPAITDRIDSVMRTYPATAPPWSNLVLARLFEAQGRPQLGLEASRRRLYQFGEWLYLAGYLQVEGRLAAATGDREGAIQAYSHWLALHANPEPSVLPDVEAVKAELARLTAERR